MNAAIIKLMKNPDIDFDEIYCAPDFPMGGTIINAAEVKESMQNGSGKAIKIQANIKYFPDKNVLVATEIPFSVYTDTIDTELTELINGEDNPGIEKYIDATNDEGAKINIYLTKGANVKKIINILYKKTSLESYYGINFIMLENGRFPRVFSWRNALLTYITHIRTCKRREVQFDLDKALARKNIVDGLIKAYSIIDEVVALIRSSSNPTEAKEKLISIHGFNKEQAEAILAMKLSSLTRLDITKLNDEAKELTIKITELTHLLNDVTALDNELIKILREVANKFGDERRTKIVNLVEESETIKVKEEEVGLLLFDNNSIRAIQKDNLQGGKRGRKGVNIKPPKNATLINTLYTTNLSTVAVVTNLGRMYHFALSNLEYEHDYFVSELIELKNNEYPILLMDSTSFNSYKNIITISKMGYIKKSSIEEYSSHTKKGIVAAKLEENDVLVGTYLSSSDNDKIFIVNSSGYYNYYDLSKINTTGRATRGVKAIKLESGETVISATIVKENISYKGLLTIASNGDGKITNCAEFPTTGRGIRGFQVMNLKDNQIAAVRAIVEEQEKIYLSANGKAVIVDINSIPVQSRMTAGIRLINTESKIIEVM